MAEYEEKSNTQIRSSCREGAKGHSKGGGKSKQTEAAWREQ